MSRQPEAVCAPKTGRLHPFDRPRFERASQVVGYKRRSDRNDAKGRRLYAGLGGTTLNATSQLCSGIAITCALLQAGRVSYRACFLSRIQSVGFPTL